MKNIFGFYLLLCTGLVYTQEGESMSTLTPLDHIIDQLEQDHQITFSFDPELVRTVSVKPRSGIQNWQEYLEKILADTELTFEIVRSKYVMLKRKAAPISKTYSFYAQVVDAESGESLPYATLQFINHKNGYQTNESGIFNFQYTNDPGDSVEIRYVGYTPVTLPIEKLEHKITLSPNALPLDDVVVSESSLLPVGYNAQEGFYGLNPKQIQLQAGWGEPDLLRMVQMLPGVNSPNETAAGLHIRGGTPDQNLILWDGIPVYHSGHFFGMFGAFNPYIIDSVKIYKGGYNAAYGGRVSGVIDINTQATPYEEARFGIGLNLINWHGYAKVPLFKKRVSFTFSTRSSIIDGWRNNTYNSIFNKLFQIGKIAEYRNIEQQELLNKNLSNFSYHETNARIQWHWKRGDGLSLSYFDSADDFKYIFEVDQEWVTHATTDQFQTINKGINLQLKKHILPSWTIDVGLIASNYQHNYDTRYTGDLNDEYHVRGNLDNTLENVSLKWINHINLCKNHQLDLGYNLNFWGVGIGLIFEQIWEEEKTEVHYDIANAVHATYFNYEFNLASRLYLKAGLRHNAVIDQQVNFWEPRFSISYLIPESNWQLKFATGRYAQYISQIIQDNELGVGDQLWATAGIDNIPVVISNDVVLGAGYDKKGLLIDIEAYSKNTTGLSKLNLDNAKTGQDGFSSGTSKAMGLEIFVQKKWNDYRAFLAYNLSKVDYQFNGFNDNHAFRPLHDQPHVLRIGNMYTYRNWEFILNFHYLSGRPYSIGDGISEHVNHETGDTYYEVSYSTENTGRLDSYHRFDISVQKKWLIKKTQLVAGVSLFNLTNASNLSARHYYIFNPDSNDVPQQNYFNEVGLNRTLNMYFRAEF